MAAIAAAINAVASLLLSCFGTLPPLALALNQLPIYRQTMAEESTNSISPNPRFLLRH